MTDSQLIAAARLGDADAWRELYERWMPWVWRYAYTLVQDSHSAEDITSEAMAAWVKNFDATGQDAAQSAAWLRSVIRHKAADLFRNAGRAKRAFGDLAYRDEQVSDARPASYRLEETELREQVLQAMARLSERHRLCLEWKYGEGLSVRKISARLGVTEKSVEASLYRARLEFRRLYQAMQPREPATSSAAARDDEAQPHA